MSTPVSSDGERALRQPAALQVDFGQRAGSHRPSRPMP
jgi:hypothetical protein